MKTGAQPRQTGAAALEAVPSGVPLSEIATVTIAPPTALLNLTKALPPVTVEPGARVSENEHDVVPPGPSVAASDPAKQELMHCPDQQSTCS